MFLPEILYHVVIIVPIGRVDSVIYFWLKASENTSLFLVDFFAGELLYPVEHSIKL